MRGVELVDGDITGEIENLTINGVDIEPLVNAELDRRYPGRAKMLVSLNEEWEHRLYAERDLDALEAR